MDAQLRERVVVVTGASGGIGSGIARAFAAEGARVVLHCHRGRDRAKRLQKSLGDAETVIVSADLRTEAGAKKLFAESLDNFGRVDTLIANAGAWEVRDIPLHQMSLAQWRRTMAGILDSTFLALREFFRV